MPKLGKGASAKKKRKNRIYNPPKQKRKRDKGKTRLAKK